MGSIGIVTMDTSNDLFSVFGTIIQFVRKVITVETLVIRVSLKNTIKKSIVKVTNLIYDTKKECSFMRNKLLMRIYLEAYEFL